MKVINKTKFKDDSLKKLLLSCARRIGINEDIVVFIHNSKKSCYRPNGLFRGLAYKCCLVYPKGFDNKGFQTSGGYTEMWFPFACYDKTRFDSMEFTEKLVKVALHEFGHIYDYQQNNKGRCLSFGEYNKNWKNRPHEIRAQKYVNEVIEKGYDKRMQEVMLKFAIALEKFCDENFKDTSVKLKPIKE